MVAKLCELRAKKGMTEEQARKQLTDASYFGTMLVVLGYADGLVSGSVHSTANTVRPALQVIKTKPGQKLVSGAFLMCFKDHVAVFADCAINLNPDAEQLSEIALQSAETARAFGIDPKVGMLSYSTLGSGKGPDVDVVEEATKLLKEKAPDLPVVGSIQFDAAWSPPWPPPRPRATMWPDTSTCSSSRTCAPATSATKPCSAPPAPWPSARCCRVSTGR